MKIYIVQGMTGEYSDSEEWLVKAYRSEEVAEDHARKAMLRAMEVMKSTPWPHQAPQGSNEFDLGMVMDYTGTEYTVLEVELDDTK